MPLRCKLNLQNQQVYDFTFAVVQEAVIWNNNPNPTQSHELLRVGRVRDGDGVVSQGPSGAFVPT